MKILSNLVISGSMLVVVASLQSINAQNKSTKMTNPLLQKSTLQYQAPAFNLIQDKHFKPAFQYSLEVHDKEILAIANNAAQPTFQNTVLALEISGEDLRRAKSVFGNLTASNTNPILQALQEEYAPIFSAHRDKMYLNAKLYKRFKAINLNTLKGEDKKLTEYYLQEFEIAGANLSDDDKEKVKKSMKS